MSQQSGFLTEATPIAPPYFTGLFRNWYPVTSYGAVGDGVTDDSAAFQAACDAAAAAPTGGVVAVPIPPRGVGYLLSSPVVLAGNNLGWWQSPGAQILDNCSTAPCITMGNSAAQMNNLRCQGLNIKAAVSKFRIPMAAFGSGNKGLARFIIRDTVLDGADTLVDGIALHAAFEGQLDGFHVNRHGGGIAINNLSEAVNVGNILYDNCIWNNSAFGLVINEAYPGGLGAQLNNSHLVNAPKLVRTVAGDFHNSPILNNALAGATSITLNAGEGANWAAGDWGAIVSSASGLMIIRVASVVGDVLNFTTSSAWTGLQFAVTGGTDYILKGAWLAALSASVRSVRIVAPHMEQANGALLANGVRNVAMVQPFFGSQMMRGLFIGWNSKQCRLDSPIAVSTTAGSVALHVANDPNSTGHRVADVQQLPAPMVALQRDGGQAIMVTERFSGQAVQYPFRQDTNVPAAQTNVQLTGPSGSVRRVTMQSYGAVIGLGLAVTGPRTNGSCTVTLFKNGVSTGITVAIDGINTTHNESNVSPVGSTGVAYFIPGDTFDLRVTTDGTWAPTVNNLDAWLICER